MRIAGRPFVVIVTIAAATLLFSGACTRRAAAPAPAQTAEQAGDFPPGCVETDVRPAIAAACMACLKTHTTSKPVNDGCCGVTDPVGRQLCDDVAKCFRAGGPPVGVCNVDGDTTTCFCGKHAAGCDDPGVANGPCIPQITAAAGRNIETKATDKPTATQIVDRYGQVQYALGRAANIAALAGAFCKAECGIGM